MKININIKTSLALILTLLFTAVAADALIMGHTNKLDVRDNKWIINKLKSSGQLYICVDLDESELNTFIKDDYLLTLPPSRFKNVKYLPNVKKEEKAALPLSLLSEDLKKALTEWTAGMAGLLVRSGRADEVRTAVSFLKRDFLFNVERCKQDRNYDLKVFVGEAAGLKNCGDNAIGCYVDEIKKTPVIYSRPNDDMFLHLLHETGHAIGFGDMGCNDNSSPAYRSPARPSIMNVHTSKGLTCDDMDGMVTIVDRFFGIKRPLLKSFCNDGVEFINGIGVKGKVEKVTECEDLLIATVYNIDPFTYKSKNEINKKLKSDMFVRSSALMDEDNIEYYKNMGLNAAELQKHKGKEFVLYEKFSGKFNYEAVLDLGEKKYYILMTKKDINASCDSGKTEKLLNELPREMRK